MGSIDQRCATRAIEARSLRLDAPLRMRSVETAAFTGNIADDGD